MDLATAIATVKSPSLRRGLTESAPIALPGALAILTGLMMQPLAGVRPVRDGLSARVAGRTLSLHQAGGRVTLRRDGIPCAVATTLEDLETAFFETLFETYRVPAQTLAQAA